MPTHKVKKPKPDAMKNAAIISPWSKAIEGRTAKWCEERRANVYVKN